MEVIKDQLKALIHAAAINNIEQTDQSENEFSARAVIFWAAYGPDLLCIDINGLINDALAELQAEKKLAA